MAAVRLQLVGEGASEAAAAGKRWVGVPSSWLLADELAAEGALNEENCRLGRVA